MVEIFRLFCILSAVLVLNLWYIIPSYAVEKASNKLVFDSESQFVEAYKAASGCFWKGDYPTAETNFLKILEQNPEFATAHIFLADSLQAQGKKQDALVHYEKACSLLMEKVAMREKLFPDVKGPEIHSDIAYCMNAMGRYEEAKKQGLIGTLKGQSPDLYVNLAYTFYKLGKTKTAQANICKAQRIAEPKELGSLVYRRITDLFEDGTQWASDCADDNLAENPGNNYALIVAVGKYRDPKINPLNYAENDGRGLYKVLTDSRTGLFKPENVVILINEDATEKNIKFKFDDMVLKANRKEDLFFVFYAGHGFTYPNGSDTYWLTYDTVVGNAEGNRIKSTAFSNLTLATKIADIEAGKMIFFIDACFSSGMVSRSSNVRGLETYLGTGKDFVIVTSSQANQKSIESPRLKHGLFSYFLIKGLSGAADANSDGFVDIEELWPYMNLYISEHAEMMGAEQDPRRSGSSGASVYLSKNPNY